MPPGMFILRYSANGRPSTMTKFSPALPHGRRASCAEMRGVWRAMLDELAEHLARHVHAGIERVARPRSTPARRLRGRTRCDSRAPRRARRRARRRRRRRRTARAAPRVRHQLGKPELEAAVRQRHGEEQVADPVLPVLAHVEERDFAAVGEPRLQSVASISAGIVLASFIRHTSRSLCGTGHRKVPRSVARSAGQHSGQMRHRLAWAAPSRIADASPDGLA